MDELDELLFEPPEIGTVLYMPGLPGGGSTIYDRSPYGSHGTIYGATWAKTEGGLWSLDYDGTDNYVEIPAAFTQLNFTSENFSVIARIYAGLTANGAIYGRGSLNVDGWCFRVISTGHLDAITNQTPAAWQRSYTSPGDVVANTWHTIGLTRNGTSINFYRDGVLLAKGSGEVAHLDPTTCARGALIGMETLPATTPFDGRIGFLRIFGGIALSAADHQRYHNKLSRL